MGAPYLLAGGVLCRPLSARVQVSRQRRGVSDPARAAQTRPCAPPAGSLTPLVSVSMPVTGAGNIRAEIVPRSTAEMAIIFRTCVHGLQYGARTCKSGRMRPTTGL